ncbi:dorsal-ventral patterning tolloid-like protein 1 [Porites lutea]|uniref:dorsal-ventral patterning tolloid-like protein 1 n=1 Tax=Porites lutea TaxID=51062 RepID=UPI003CC5B592
MKIPQIAMLLRLLIGLSLLEIVFGASCDKKSSGSYGRITSPDYYSRSSYANNQDCQLDIKVSSGYAVKLTWSYFDVKGDMPNCYDDYVEIYIGCSRNSIGKYCSDNSYKPHDIYSPDNCLRIKFRSDSSGSGKGFVAAYSRISKSSLAPGLSRFCSSKYSPKTLSSNSGIMNSRNWPQDYPSYYQDCYWKIEVGKDQRIKIAFMDFDLDNDFGCDDDKVKVKGGSSSRSYDSSTTVRNSMCGSKSPFFITSSYDRIWIRFKSNSRNRKRGFVAGYVLYKDSKSSSTTSTITGIVVGIIILAVIAGCIYYVFVYRRRLAKRQAAAGQHAMTAQFQVPPPQVGVPHPPPPSQPGYGPPPPAGYGAPPPPGTVPSPGYAPPPYSQVVAAPYPQQDKTGQYPPPQGGPAPYPVQQTAGAPPYPPGQPLAVAPYPPEQPGGAPGYPTAPPAGVAPYPAVAPGGTTPYPSAAPGGSAPYPTAPP